MPHVVDAIVVMNAEIAADHYRLVLKAPEIAADAKPGQFCMVQVQEGYYPFLRRPMCFERLYPDSFSIVYRVAGEGTRVMSRFQPGQAVNVQGPLGNAFPLPSGYQRYFLVGGGVGIAPFPALAEALVRELRVVPEVIVAARSARFLTCVEQFKEMGCRIHTATDDGSMGFHGFAADLLATFDLTPEDVVYCCGPTPMMQAVHRVCARSRTLCYASLEAEMACGDGVCLGCVVEAKVEVEFERMLRVCCDGPTFDTRLLQWDPAAEEVS
jgi:dihydroorotate dehydrogenase electron transfer subunit